MKKASGPNITRTASFKPSARAVIADPGQANVKVGSGTARDLYSIEDAVTDAVTERIALNLH